MDGEPAERRKKSSYSRTGKLMHWGFVLVYIYGISKQVDDLSQLEDSAFFRFEIVFATIFLLLLAIRFAYMRLTQRTALPENTGAWQKLAAKSVHLGMYVSIAGIAVTGLMIGGLFWLDPGNRLLMQALISLHELAVDASYVLVAIHVAAAVYHRFKADGVWNAMVPFWKERAENR